jgi:hypothetical protein
MYRVKQEIMTIYWQQGVCLNDGIQMIVIN